MKIAIPTCDSVHIASDFGRADSFLVVTIQAEEIVNEVLRRNTLNTCMEKEMGPLSLISDCSAVLVNEVGNDFCELIRQNRMECIETDEGLITAAIIHYLANEYRKESNTCCCP